MVSIAKRLGKLLDSHLDQVQAPITPLLSYQPDSPSQGFATRDREELRIWYVKHQAVEELIGWYRMNPYGDPHRKDRIVNL